MNWTRADITHAIDFARKHRGDCTMLMTYVVHQVLLAEGWTIISPDAPPVASITRDCEETPQAAREVDPRLSWEFLLVAGLVLVLLLGLAGFACYLFNS